jgi:hypothetical protein
VIKIVVLLAILAAVLSVGDVEARVFAEHQFAHRIDANVPGAHATVKISSFPFVGRLITSGTVQKIRAHVVNVTSGVYTFDTVDVSVTGVRLDRTVLLHDQRIQVLGIQSGTVTADMTEAAIDKALGGLPVQLNDGSVRLTVKGVSVVGTLSITGNQLHLDVAGAPITVAIPKLPLLPCASSAVVTTGHLQVTCILTGIPPALVGAGGSVTA